MVYYLLSLIKTLTKKPKKRKRSLKRKRIKSKLSQRKSSEERMAKNQFSNCLKFYLIIAALSN